MNSTSHIHISPHHTSQAESTKKYEVYCENPVRDHPKPTQSTRITTKNERRRSWRAERAKKYDFFHENPVQEHPWTTKSTKITTKHENRRSWSGEKVRELPRETHFGPSQDHRRTPKSTRITTKNEHRRSWRAGNYENNNEKPAPDHVGHPKSTRITTKNEHASTKIATNSVRHLDLAPRPFTTTVRTPSVNHTVWGTNPSEKLLSQNGCMVWLRTSHVSPPLHQWCSGCTQERMP